MEALSVVKREFPVTTLEDLVTSTKKRKKQPVLPGEKTLQKYFHPNKKKTKKMQPPTEKSQWCFANIDHYQDTSFDIAFYEQNADQTLFCPSKFSVPCHLVETWKQMSEVSTITQKDELFELVKASEPLTYQEIQYINMIKSMSNSDLSVLPQIILKKRKANLSNIYWFVVNYSKAKNITFDQFNSKIHIHTQYNNCQNVMGSNYFDVFCRHKRILIEFIDDGSLADLPYPPNDKHPILWVSQQMNDNKIGYRDIHGKRYIYLITTVGQLNFFMWAITLGIDRYVEDNVADIESHHRRVKQNHATEKKSNKRTRLIKDNPLHDLL